MTRGRHARKRTKRAYQIRSAVIGFVVIETAGRAFEHGTAIPQVHYRQQTIQPRAVDFEGSLRQETIVQ